MNFTQSYKNLFLIMCFFININFLFSYSPTKSTEIAANPNKYIDKEVLVYIKFDSLSLNSGRYKTFTELNVKEINYRYDSYNKNLREEIEKLKNRDKVTIKGKVKMDGFKVTVDIDTINKDWVDTNLLPATPDTINITCPKCGETFKYKITNEDYKESIINNRNKDTITKVVSNKPKNNITDSFKKKQTKTKKSNNIAKVNETQKSMENWTF